MSFSSYSFHLAATLYDKKRDVGLEVDPSIRAHYDIQYGESKKYNSLDVYYPKGTKQKLPVIVNFHGGGYVHGTKKSYLYYGMFMAKQGFVFVNANYHLAPKKQYPTQLEELNQVMTWVSDNSDEYYIDSDNLFIVGDSAGAQLAAQYAAIYSNRDYDKLMPFHIPEEMVIRAMALNCGMYDIYDKLDAYQSEDGRDTDLKQIVLLKDYLGENWREYEEELAVKKYITSDFPPSFVMTAENDILRKEALPMMEFLHQRDVQVKYKKYGMPGDDHMIHIFHCNLHLEAAKECNREQCAFFRSFIS